MLHLGALAVRPMVNTPLLHFGGLVRFPSLTQARQDSLGSYRGPKTKSSGALMVLKPQGSPHHGTSVETNAPRDGTTPNGALRPWWSLPPRLWQEWCPPRWIGSGAKGRRLLRVLGFRVAMDQNPNRRTSQSNRSNRLYKMGGGGGEITDPKMGYHWF